MHTDTVAVQRGDRLDRLNNRLTYHIGYSALRLGLSDERHLTC